jgi:hypothetical protein
MLSLNMCPLLKTFLEKFNQFQDLQNRGYRQSLHGSFSIVQVISECGSNWKMRALAAECRRRRQIGRYVFVLGLSLRDRIFLHLPAPRVRFSVTGRCCIGATRECICWSYLLLALRICDVPQLNMPLHRATRTEGRKEAGASLNRCVTR